MSFSAKGLRRRWETEGEERSELDLPLLPLPTRTSFSPPLAMVQLFNSQTSYPSTSIVAYHNGLYQTLSYSSPISVRIKLTSSRPFLPPSTSPSFPPFYQLTFTNFSFFLLFYVI